MANDIPKAFIEESETEKFETFYAIKIHKFSDINFREPIRSRCITLRMNFGKCYLNIYQRSCDDYMHFFLNIHRNREETKPIYGVLFKICFYNMQKKKLFSMKKQVHYQDDTPYIAEEFITLAQIEHSILKENIVDDVLILDFSVIQSYMTTRKFNYLAVEKKSVSYDFSKLYYSKEFADISIQVQNRVFKAHTLILITRSEIFKNIFLKRARENELGPLVIQNVSADVFQEVLQYIYTDEISDESKVSVELCIAAEMYDLEGLRKLCEKVLLQNASSRKNCLENAISMFHHADSVNNKEIKEAAVEIVARNGNKFDNTDLDSLYNEQVFINELMRSISLASQD